MLTKNIEEKLGKSKVFDEKMIEDNAPPKLHKLLCNYIKNKEMTKVELIRRLNIDRNYGYWILNGSRIPTRNCLIRISLLLELDVDQINYLLRLAEKSPLYVRNTVDARAFFAIKQHMSYDAAVEFIWDGSVT